YPALSLGGTVFWIPAGRSMLEHCGVRAGDPGLRLSVRFPFHGMCRAGAGVEMPCAELHNTAPAAVKSSLEDPVHCHIFRFRDLISGGGAVTRSQSGWLGLSRGAPRPLFAPASHPFDNCQP